MIAQPLTSSSNQLGRPLGTGRDWRRRLLLHHLPLAAGSGVLLVVFMALPPFTKGAFPLLDMGASAPLPQPAPYGGHGGGGRTGEAQFTLASGYVATVLLGLTLLIGPANLLFRRRSPVSTSLARDTGIWAAIASFAHVIVGLKAHGYAANLFNFRNYFFQADGTPRTDSFGWGNWVGLAAVVILAGLLALSNDRSLRELKARRWKNLQRTNYALFALVVLHAFFYGALLRMTSPFTLVLIVTLVAVLAGQAVGIALWRRRHASIAAPHAGD
jgi:methionine sulfoxide reductase heme-binding subunit